MAIELTRKEKGFVKDLIKTDDGTQAILNHYDIRGKKPKTIASVMANQNLKKLKIRKALKPALIRYEKELSAILDAMELKDKNSEEYKVLVDAADKIQKQVQLLSGGSTERIESILTQEQIDAIILRRAKENSTGGEI